MTFAGHSNATWTKTYGKIAYSTGNVGIGTDNPSYKLHVEGDIYTSTCVRIGGGSISWDADTGAFHFSHGVYTDGFISAKGANDDAGGTVAGGGSGEVHLKDIVDMADEWKLITSVSEIPATMSRWPSWSEVTGKPSTFAPSAHTHDWDDISGKPSTFAPSSHTHTWAQVTGKPSWITTNDGSGSGIDADLLDGTHKSGLFTAMSYSSNKLSITVGGTTKSVTIQAGSSGSYLPLRAPET